MLKGKEVERAFLGMIRLVKEESEGMDAPEESTTTQRPKWDQAFPSLICAVLEEYDDVFPQDLSLVLPPVRHEFKDQFGRLGIPNPSPILQDEPALAGRGQETT